VTLLEKNLTASKPTYQAYMQRTPAFIPWFPRTRRTSRWARPSDLRYFEKPLIDRAHSSYNYWARPRSVRPPRAVPPLL